jgi:hypothetical protein
MRDHSLMGPRLIAEPPNTQRGTMNKIKNSIARVTLAALLLLCASTAGAVTYTLQDLVTGNATFVSGDGTLTFSDFNVTQTKKMSSDLSLYIVTVLDDGFSLSSAEFTANGGGLRKFDMSYKVTAASGTTISGAGMAMDATRTTGRVKAEKDLEDPNSDEGTFLLTLLRNNRSDLADSDTFGPGVTVLEVEEAVRIKKVSAINSLDNTYTVVAEPEVLSMLSLGLAGLVWTGRRRRA